MGEGITSTDCFLKTLRNTSNQLRPCLHPAWNNKSNEANQKTDKLTRQWCEQVSADWISDVREKLLPIVFGCWGLEIKFKKRSHPLEIHFEIFLNGKTKKIKNFPSFRQVQPKPFLGTNHVPGPSPACPPSQDPL